MHPMHMNIEHMMNSMMADMDSRMQALMSGAMPSLMHNYSPMARSSMMSPYGHNFGGGFRGDFGSNMIMQSSFGHHDMGNVQSPGNHRQRHVVVSTQKMGPDGRLHSENYYTNEVFGTTADGQQISQKEEMYKNDRTGEKKITQEKALNGIKHKVTKKQKRGGSL